MKAKLFKELERSLVQAIEHAQGKRSLRTTVLPRPPGRLSAAQVRGLRDRVNASQAVFAHCLNVSTQLVQSWEGGRRTPTGAALRLLELARREPTLVFPALLPPGQLIKRVRIAHGRGRRNAR